MCIWEFVICTDNIGVLVCSFVFCLCCRPCSVCVCVYECVSFGVFVIMSLNIPPFWDVMMRCWASGFLHIVGTFCVYPEESSGLLWKYQSFLLVCLMLKYED